LKTRGKSLGIIYLEKEFYYGGEQKIFLKYSEKIYSNILIDLTLDNIICTNIFGREYRSLL
jgi:hypothetical protein